MKRSVWARKLVVAAARFICLELSVMLGYVVLYAQFKGESLGEEELGESCVADGIEILLASAERLELGLSVGLSLIHI